MNPQILNLSPTDSDSAKQEASDRAVELERDKIDDLMQQTRSDVRNIRARLEQQEDEQESHSRRTKIVSIVLCALVVILAGAFWFAYPTVRDHPQAATEVVGLKRVASALGGSVQAMEAKLDKTAAGMPGLTTRMDQLQASMKSGLQTASTQAQAAATQVGQKIRADFNQTVQVIQSRMSGLESNQRESIERVNKLQQQISGLQQELASMRVESTTSAERLKQLQDEQQARASALSNIDQKMTSQQTTLDSLSSRVDRKRIQFDVASRQNSEIAPGISLNIRKTNAGKQQLDGTLQVAAESRTFALSSQGIQKPVVFYTAGETRPIEVVFTQVTKNGASGYVMMPRPEIATTSRADNIQ